MNAAAVRFIDLVQDLAGVLGADRARDIRVLSFDLDGRLVLRVTGAAFREPRDELRAQLLEKLPATIDDVPVQQLALHYLEARREFSLRRIRRQLRWTAMLAARGWGGAGVGGLR